jgi:chromosome partitioning protein
VKFETPSKKLVDSFPMLRKKYDFVLIDLPGQDSNDNRMIIRDADLIIVPFRPTQADLDTLPSVKSWFDVITKAKGAIKTLWVINEASTLTAKDKKDAELFMSAFGVKPARTVIHSRAAYKDCMSMGMGAIEMGNTKASTEISGLYTELLGIIENYPVLQDNTLYHEVIQ